MGATRIFEVDHPNTSAAKQRCLQDAKSLAPVRYVKVEFNSDNLDKMLASAGYDPMRRTFFLWEGVTNYLTEAAVRHTFSFVGKAAPASLSPMSIATSSPIRSASTTGCSCSAGWQR